VRLTWVDPSSSSWLIKTQSGTSRLSRWVWVIGMFLFIVGALQAASYWISNLLLQCAGIGIGLWYYASHTSSSNQQPTAVGGSAHETAGSSSPSTSTAGGHSTSSSPHVTPTFTLTRRDTVPTPTALALIRVPPEDDVQASLSGHNKRHWLHNF